jgi:hypothetical protein
MKAKQERGGRICEQQVSEEEGGLSRHATSAAEPFRPTGATIPWTSNAAIGFSLTQRRARARFVIILDVSYVRRVSQYVTGWTRLTNFQTRGFR